MNIDQHFGGNSTYFICKTLYFYMKLTAIYFLALSLISCNYKSKDEKNQRKTKLDRFQAISSKQLDFCNSCDSLQKWVGGIQGVQVTDSTGIFPMAECHTNHSFDLIWVPKGEIIKAKAEIPDNYYDNFHYTDKENYRRFDCYAFIISKKKPKPESSDCDCEGDDFDYVFPSNVTIYKNSNGSWVKQASKKVRNFEELGRLKLNTIFNVN
jgi:hypothetical protein